MKTQAEIKEIAKMVVEHAKECPQCFQATNTFYMCLKGQFIQAEAYRRIDAV